MDRRNLTPEYSVSGQILPEDLTRLAKEGVELIINNRPDAEVPPDLSSAAMRAAADELGLSFIDNPVAMSALGMEVGGQQKAAIETATGPVHAYCGSGTRSTIAWALGEAGSRDADEILTAAARAGYSLEGIRPLLEAAAAKSGERPD